MKSTSLWECPSGSRRQRSPALSAPIYKAYAATCQGQSLGQLRGLACVVMHTDRRTNLLRQSTSGAAMLLCLTEDGLLSVLSRDLEVSSQEKVLQKADRG